MLSQHTEQTTTLNKRSAELEREAGELQGKLAAIESERPPANYWHRIIAGVLVAAAILIVVAVAVVLIAGR